MIRDKNLASRIFNVFNITFLIILALSCIVPFLHIIAISFSEKSKVTSGMVTLLPVDFTLDAYRFVLSRNDFYDAFLMTLKRVSLGYCIGMTITIITAYPLSKESSVFKARTFYVWLLFFTILFTGGLIPTYLTVRSFHLLDSVFALTLPCAVEVFHIVLLLNFFRGVPKELEESALMDGAKHFTILWKIYVPVSMPAIATLSLFNLVFHWNQYFDGIIYMLNPENYPLQSYLYTLIRLLNNNLEAISTDIEMYEVVQRINVRTFRAAQIIMVSAPILCTYPYLQKYFVKGIVLGSVKG